MLPPQFHKIRVIAFLDEDVFAVVATIVDVVILARFEVKGGLHVKTSEVLIGQLAWPNYQPDR